MIKTIVISLIPLFLIVLVAVWNGLVIRWEITSDIRYSNSWHVTGWVIRALLVALSYLISGVYYAIGAVVLATVIYNMIINIIIGQHIFYVGTTSKLDILIRKLFH